MNNIPHTSSVEQKKYVTRSTSSDEKQLPASAIFSPGTSYNEKTSTIESIIKPPKNAAVSDFTEKVKIWVVLNQHLKAANEQIRQIREKKHHITEDICNFMNTKDWQHRNILVSDGELRFYDKKEYSPLTYGYVEKSLSNIIQDKSHVEFIIKYLKDNREVVTMKDIRHVVKCSG
jgi:hypothetical protein